MATQVNPFRKVTELLIARRDRQQKALVETELQLSSAQESGAEWEEKQRELFAKGGKKP